MKCSNCGKELNEGEVFCTNCGAKVTDQTQNSNPNPAPNPAPTFQNNVNTGYMPNNAAPVAPSAPAYQDPKFDYTPISMWGYFGYELLFAIPCVGFILLLVFSFGGTKTINLRNFARSYFCLLIIVAILILIFVVLGGAAGILYRF